MSSPLGKFSLESLEFSLELYMQQNESKMKFCILHLDNAIELILKEKLRSLGISIYEKGKTVDFHKAISILEENGVKIKEKADLEMMRDDRNVLQHKGGHVTIDQTKFYIETTFNFMERFLRDELKISLKNSIPERFYNLLSVERSGEIPISSLMLEPEMEEPEMEEPEMEEPEMEEPEMEEPEMEEPERIESTIKPKKIIKKPKKITKKSRKAKSVSEKQKTSSELSAYALSVRDNLISQNNAHKIFSQLFSFYTFRYTDHLLEQTALKYGLKKQNFSILDAIHYLVKGRKLSKSDLNDYEYVRDFRNKLVHTDYIPNKEDINSLDIKVRNLSEKLHSHLDKIRELEKIRNKITITKNMQHPFSPSILNVKRDEIVIWENHCDKGHTITSGKPQSSADGVFDSGIISPTKSFEFVFTSKGIYHYFCLVHPWETGMVSVD